MIIVMTANYTYQGVSYTNGQTYRVRAKDGEAIIKAVKASKSKLKK